MHRVRAWARAKAHGQSSLAERTRSSTGRSNAATTLSAAPAEAVTDESPVAASSEPKAEGDAEAPKNVFVRFFTTMRSILFSSIINILLVFVPVGIAVRFAGMSAGIVFAMNAIAIIPLAGLLSYATESVASRLGDTIGALMNVTFGNAVELIIFIIALVKNQIRIVQASLLGSILANLLLILGMCFLLGGLRFREQIYNSTVTQMSACLLSLSVMSLLLPTAFHASFSDLGVADTKVLQVSRGTSVVLLLVYALYLLFQLNSHAYMYESTPQHIIEREAMPGPAAHYFNSSSSSSSSSSSDSDTDSSGRSTGTAKKIKRMMKKGRRSSKRDYKSQQTSSSTTVDNAAPEASRDFGGGPSSAGIVGHGDDVSPPAAPAVFDDTMDEADEMHHTRSKKDQRKKRKHHRHKHHHHHRPVSSGAGENLTPSLSAPEQGEGDPRRVDFAATTTANPDTTDIEAQTDAPHSRPPFSLRALRPPIPRSIAQNVFTAPRQPPAAGPTPAPQLRRAASMPGDSRGQVYRIPPGAVPPIIPIIVNSTPKTTAAEEEDKEPEISRTTAIVLLLISTGLVALCAELMVDSISDVVEGDDGLSEAFIGLILLPIVGNAAEHVTAVTVAMKNKMDLAIGVALGSSIQIALFVTPLVVMLGWIMGKDMSLYFTLFETVSMFVSAFIVNFLVLDGRSNYLEGALLCSAYVIIAVAAFFYPNAEAANDIGGGDGGGGEAAVAGVKLLARSLAGAVGL